MTSQEAVDYVSKRLSKGKISKIIEEMMDNIIPNDMNEKGGLGCDNMTCVIITLNN